MRLCEDCGREMELVPVRWCGSNAYIWKCPNDDNLAPVKNYADMDIETQIRHPMGVCEFEASGHMCRAKDLKERCDGERSTCQLRKAELERRVTP